MVNKAIDLNPPTADLHLANSGSDWDWAVFALMLFSDLGLIAWTFLRRDRGIRLFHYLGILILTTTAIAYYSMASNLGNTPIQVQYLRGRSPGTTRAVWYARYIDWFITTPSLLLMLLLATGLNVSSILMVIFFDIVMVVVGLLGALTHSAYKWGYYAFGLAALVYVWTALFRQGYTSAIYLGSDTGFHFLRLASYLSFLWMLYPVCWALSEGGNVISPTSEMVFYGGKCFLSVLKLEYDEITPSPIPPPLVLDLLTKPVFIFALLFSMRNMDYTRFGLMSLKASATAEDAAPMGFGVGRHTAMANTGSGGVTGGNTAANRTTGADASPNAGNERPSR